MAHAVSTSLSEQGGRKPRSIWLRTGKWVLTSTRKQGMSGRTTPLDLSVLPRALALLCMVDGHGRSQAASQVLLCVTNHPGTQLSSYYAHGFRGSGVGRGPWGRLVSNPQCLGLSREDSGAGGDLTAEHRSHQEAWPPAPGAWPGRTRNRGCPS